MNSLKGAVTLPRGFRLNDTTTDLNTPEILPSTPEPMAQDTRESTPIARPPSPPRQRMKLKKRNLTLLTAPTQQFLASVEAADMPIPSIEEPDPNALEECESATSMTYPVMTSLAPINDGSLAVPRLRGRAVTPRTPMPGHAPSLSPSRYPDWSIDSAAEHESSPECESSRPSTARSTLTSASVFSRSSILSDEATFTDPDAKPAGFGLLGTPFAAIPPHANYDSDIVMEDHSERMKLRKAPWTKAMSDHLWSTYIMYLQDPKVTPFNPGRNGLPPNGVCMRVSRAAKKTWKATRISGASRLSRASRSATPVGAPIKWPHTCAATRQHLRELCRVRSASSFVRAQLPLPDPRNGRLMSRQYRRTTSFNNSNSAFSARDMAVSLTVSTSESMQPYGPLAQLAMSIPLGVPASASSEEFPTMSEEPSPVLDFFGTAPRRLMSPAPITRSNSTGSNSNRGLQSPVHLTRSRSNTQHQKRRSRQPSQVPRRIKRPSLGGDLYIDPTKIGLEFERRRTRSNSEFIPRDQFVRPTMEDLLYDVPCMPPMPPAMPGATASSSQNASLQAPSLAPSAARLGSPFPGALNTSFTFPARVVAHTERHSEFDARAVADSHKPFATAQEFAVGSAISESDEEEKPDLQSNLAYIDSRLREIHEQRLR